MTDKTKRGPGRPKRKVGRTTTAIDTPVHEAAMKAKKQFEKANKLPEDSMGVQNWFTMLVKMGLEQLKEDKRHGNESTTDKPRAASTR